ncbi:ECF-type sigma factor [Tahibacter amnicola]|uniref:ECF-type sigma factor n=1 Tax=Tahibacter amnicola TaxID=2976241 RepID=A0ABY6BD00_9GAMM|nr:ECF-type sigma factor [Tahibacter amnicola]UXI66205.1 ECF-type sigma factor [Tahibacter amnicola]
MIHGTPSLDITGLLQAWKSGDRAAESQLMDVMYPMLRDIARARLRRNPGSITLSATEVANEAYARLVQHETPDWADRSHFLAVAAQAIRYFVVDYVRARDSEKRGGGIAPVSLSDSEELDILGEIDLSIDWLGIDKVLTELEALDPACAQVVELKFFSGLTTDEIASAIGISRATVVRHWRFARAWLADRIHR